MSEQVVADKISTILKYLAAMAQPGTNLLDLEAAAEKLLDKLEVKATNLGYHPKWSKVPYPKILCLDIDGIIAHGIPHDRVLEEGEILTIDLGIYDADNYYADACLTIPIGEIDNRKRRLLYYAKKVLYEVIDTYFYPGTDTKDIAEFIQSWSRTRGYEVNRRFGGHRIKQGEMHAHPKIYNTPEPTHKYGKLKEGYVYCIEPMLTPGKDNLGAMLPDGWAYATKDGQPSAFFEHMVLVTKDGPKILTSHIDKD